jgi:hypothetical protein
MFQLSKYHFWELPEGDNEPEDFGAISYLRVCVFAIAVEVTVLDRCTVSFTMSDLSPKPD